MKFETILDRRIYKAIQGFTAANPQTLMGIISGVDASERLVLTHDELSGGLQRLVTANLISEIEYHRFCEASKTDSASTFTGLTEPDHAAAVEGYRAWFQQQLEHIDDEPGEDDFVWLKLVLRWATPNGRWPTDDDEDDAEQLATLIDPTITQSGLGEINGFQHNSGYIDVMIFGKATDTDVDQTYELLAPTFRAHKCSVGSRIIKVYNERNEEIESDIVSDNAT